MGFQSLVVVDLARVDQVRPPTVSRHPDVSILVVVDQPRCQRGPEPGSRAHGVFQSLLSWISLASARLRASRQYRVDGVSILVVVDQPPRFNLWSIAEARDRGVSILVVVDQPRRHALGGRRTQPVRFQSLLSWIWSRQRLRGRPSVTALRRFNPCCRGSVADNSPLAAIHGPGVFQSLLSWICLADNSTASRSPRRQIMGFNPCCRGSASLTGRLWPASVEVGPDVLFQSLLSWIGLFG